MAYKVFLNDVLLPVTPSKIDIKIKNKNKTIDLINEGEINLIKTPGLVEINFKAEIPFYPMHYAEELKEPSFYVDFIKDLKAKKMPFRFIISRSKIDGTPLFDTNFSMVIEDFKISESFDLGMTFIIDLKLKQYKIAKTKKLEVNAKTGEAKIVENRPKGNEPTQTTHTIKKGDTLHDIARKYYGSADMMEELKKANNLGSEKLALDTLLILPRG